MGKVVIQLIEPAVGIIELAEGFSVPLTFSVADIRDLSKRKGATSKSIKIPGTKNNNKILNNLFDANVITKTFDYNKLQKCIVIEDGIVILDNAFIQLIEINNKPDSANWVGNVEYTALVKDDVSTFFTQIDGKMLSDLKLGEYNHTFDASTIISMMNNTHVDGIKYHFNYNNSLTNYNLSNFTPDVFAKTYFDKIIADAGFVYEWPSMTGDTVRFDEVIIPWNGDAFKFEYDTSGQYNTRIQKTGTTTYNPTQSGGVLTGTTSSIDFNNKVYDENNYFNLTTDKYTNTFYISPNSAQLLNIRMDINYQIKMVNNEATTVYIVNDNQGVNFWETFSGFNLEPYVKIKNPSVTFGDVEQSFGGKNIRTTQAQGGFGYPATPVYYSLASGETIILDSRAIVNPSITVCNPTNQLGFEIGMKVDGSTATYFRKGKAVTDALADVKYEFIIQSIECDIEPQLSAQGYGTTVDMNKYIPKMKQSEFISSFLNLYNLYVDVDKDNDRKLIFTLRDDFYDAGKQKDWSKKLAKNLGTDIKLLPELSNKKLLLTYKQDDADEAMKGYRASTGEVYGQVEYTYDSEYVKGEQKKELLFSPVVTTQDDNGNYLPFLAANPKGNVKIALNAKQMTSALPLVIENYPGSTQQTTQVPLIHSWNEPKNASFDLNFGLNDYYFYYDTGSFTNNNMYNLHWRRTVNQINKGKMLTAYFNLNSSDIKNLKLNDSIVINNTIWNINQVIDYQPSLNKPTKVELISVDDSVRFAKFKTKKPVKPLPGNPTIDSIRNNDSINTGNGGIGGNVILGTDSAVSGTDNIIGAGATGTIVRGKGNITYSTGTIIGHDNNVGAGAGGTIVTGTKNNILAQATVNGDSNTIESGSAGSNVTGVGNILNTQATVNGDGNVIEKGATGSVINGTRNAVKVQSTVFGDNNVVMSAATKSVIFGSNITASESDTVYVDNIKVYDTITLQTGSTIDITDGTLVGFDYLPLSGGTLTGQINITSATISSLGGGTPSKLLAVDSSNNIVNAGPRVVKQGSGANSLISDNASTNIGSGDYSIALGRGNNSTAYGIAMGEFNTASNYFAIAMGGSNNVTGTRGIGLGELNVVSNNFSIAIGASNETSGQGGASIGRQNKVYKNYGFAAGYNNTSDGNSSISMGSNNIVIGNYSTAIGLSNESTGENAISIGHYNEASQYSIAIGQGNTTSNYHAVAIGGASTVTGDKGASIGYNNTVTASNAIALGRNITADVANTTFVDGLNIKTLSGGGASVNNLGIDSNGKVVIGTGGAGSNIVYDTYANINTMRFNSTLNPGKFYYITDRDIMLSAVKNNMLSLTGERVFNIIKDSYYTPSISTIGAVTTHYGGIYGQTIARGSYPNGVTLSVNRYVIWGGQLWQRNTSGADTPGTSQENIQAGWTLVPRSNATFYEPKVFNIKYNFVTDTITEQSDDRGNIISTSSLGPNFIDNTDWGAPGLFNNKCYGVYNNYKLDSTTISIYSNTNSGRIVSNYGYNLSIYHNTNTGNIERNFVSVGLYMNDNNGNIENNQMTDGCFKNNNTGNISNNFFTDFVSNNINNGDISDNDMGRCSFNRNNGGILRNKKTTGGIGINNNNNNGNIGNVGANTNRSTTVSDTVTNK